MIQKSKDTKGSPGERTSLTRVFEEGVPNKIRCDCQRYILKSTEKKVLLPQKSPPQLKVYRKYVIPELFYSFKPFRVLKFAMVKWFLGEICFFKVFLSLCFFSQTVLCYFIMRKIFYLVHISHQVRY